VDAQGRGDPSCDVPRADFYRAEGLLLDVNSTSSETVVAAIRAHVGA
jgi:hypothetical protein